MQYSQPLLQRRGKLIHAGARRYGSQLKEKCISLLQLIKSLGIRGSMEDHDQRKLGIFNQLNFFQLLTGLLIPFTAFFTSSLPTGYYIVLCLPASVSGLLLYLAKKQKHEEAVAASFVLYPFVAAVVYMYGLNPGTGLFYIFWGILSVFFLKDTGYMLFCLFFSLVSYFLLTVVIKHYVYELKEISYGLYLFNQAIAILFIFYSLFLIKKDYTGYQLRILSKNRMLEEKNTRILQQSERIQDDSQLLKKQAAELGELNVLKNKMFGIISHDLKAPVIALRNLFRNVQEKKMTAAELKRSVPDIVSDLNYTAGLMENLLQWARAQMQADTVNPEDVDMRESVNEVIQLLKLQAAAKGITIENEVEPGVFGYIDRNMNILVLRNLLSNAIKFTPENGKITLGAHVLPSFIEVYVKDSGVGISAESMRKINSADFYSTHGTASEPGTGLGLMLCKEFLVRNNSRLHIESEPGAGSVFSYSIPMCA